MSEDDQKHSDHYDPYYRNFPSNLLPVRTPFTRAGRHGAGQVFIYMTRKWVRWSLLLDHTRMERIYDEARECIPAGFSQFWLLEKRYSTQKPRMRGRGAPRRAGPDQSDQSHLAEIAAEPPPTALAEKLCVVLRDPPQQPDGKGDILSYYLHEAEAVAAANAYTRQQQRRAVVGRLLWDELWF
jgi:hypothetical protein